MDLNEALAHHFQLRKKLSATYAKGDPQIWINAENWGALCAIVYAHEPDDAAFLRKLKYLALLEVEQFAAPPTIGEPFGALRLAIWRRFNINGPILHLMREDI